MPYDIYGNNLRQGHCEVHPHVHEEYPCSVCIAEKQQLKSQLHREYQKQMEADHAAHEVQRLRAEVERLRNALKEIADYPFNKGHAPGVTLRRMAIDALQEQSDENI